MTMKWASAVSDKTSLTEAIQTAAGTLRANLGSQAPDLAIIFVSHQHADEYELVPGLVRDALGPRVLIGCSAGGVIGGGHEVENRAGVSLTAAFLPGTEIIPIHLETALIPDLDDSPRAWHELLALEPSENLHFIILPEPFSFDAETFLLGLDYAYPRSVKIGGLASGGSAAGQNVLYIDNEIQNSGAICLALSGGVRLETVVAQGCRPIGSTSIVTKLQGNQSRTGNQFRTGNLMTELDGRPPMEVLREVYRELNARDQELFNHSLFLGVVMDETDQEYHQGDFLIRNIIGADRRSGALAVAALLREGQVVQFHLRDAVTSAEDLQSLLARYAAQSPTPAAGCLLFSCLGRGSYLYGRSDHDTDTFREIVGNIPIGGFFCNGEIGPVAGATHIHGYTSSFGLFRPL